MNIYEETKFLITERFRLNNEDEMLNLSDMCLLDLDRQSFSSIEIKVLILSKNRFHMMPKLLFSFVQLRVLDLSNNYIRKINKNLINLRNLEILNLTNNCLSEWPDWLCSDMSQLQSLALNKNSIVCIPLSFPDMKNLKEIYFDWWILASQKHL